MLMRYHGALITFTPPPRDAKTAIKFAVARQICTSIYLVAYPDGAAQQRFRADKRREAHLLTTQQLPMLLAYAQKKTRRVLQQKEQARYRAA